MPARRKKSARKRARKGPSASLAPARAPETTPRLPEGLRALPVAVAELRPHPRNYRAHPEDQLAHIVASIRAHGFYRNVVAARDLTILAGHGVVAAARSMGMSTVPVVRLELDADDPRALRLLAGDNEIGRGAEVDDRVLTDMLRELASSEGGLLGTGFDSAMLSALAMVTRPASEIGGANAAGEWGGMPEFTAAGGQPRVIVSFETEQDQARFMKLIGATVVNKRVGSTITLWWPEKPKEDLNSLRFDALPGSADEGQDARSKTA